MEASGAALGGCWHFSQAAGIAPLLHLSLPPPFFLDSSLRREPLTGWGGRAGLKQARGGKRPAFWGGAVAPWERLSALQKIPDLILGICS